MASLRGARSYLSGRHAIDTQHARLDQRLDLAIRKADFKDFIGIRAWF